VYPFARLIPAKRRRQCIAIRCTTLQHVPGSCSICPPPRESSSSTAKNALTVGEAPKSTYFCREIPRIGQKRPFNAVSTPGTTLNPSHTPKTSHSPQSGPPRPHFQPHRSPSHQAAPPRAPWRHVEGPARSRGHTRHPQTRQSVRGPRSYPSSRRSCYPGSWIGIGKNGRGVGAKRYPPCRLRLGRRWTEGWTEKVLSYRLTVYLSFLV